MDSILGENRVRQLQVLGVEYETDIKGRLDKIKGQEYFIVNAAKQSSAGKSSTGESH